jgi:hypothetical protein
MSTRVVYNLVGYDKRTEKLTVAFDVPRGNVARAKSIAGIAIDDDTQVGDRELTSGPSEEIARLIHAELDADRYDCFLEPYVLHDGAARN